MLIATSKEQTQNMMCEFKDATEKVGLTIHPNKTKILSNQSNMNYDTKKIYIKIGEMSIEILAKSESIQETLEIKSRIRAAWATFHKYRQELTSKKYMLKLRLRLFDATVSPTLCYAAGTWTPSREHERMIQSTQRKILRLIVQTKRKYKKIEKQDIEPKDEKGIIEKTENCSTDDESGDGQSTTSKDDVDSEVTFDSHFGSRPFCSNVVLLARTTSCLFVSFALGKTWCNAAQRLVSGPGWVGPIHPWLAAPSSAVAHGAGFPSDAARARCRPQCTRSTFGSPSTQEVESGEGEHTVDSATAFQTRRSGRKARKRVGQLQAAIQLLDSSDPARTVLEEELKRAKSRATLPSLEEQIRSTEQFVGRAKKRLEDAEKEVISSVQKRDCCRAELASSEDRLASLREQMNQGGTGCSVPERQLPPDVIAELEQLRAMASSSADRDAEVRRLREQVAQFEGNSTPTERPRVRQRTEHIPHMPGLIQGELAHWMDDRQGELQDALRTDDTNRILELTSKLSEGAERLAEMRVGMVP